MMGGWVKLALFFLLRPSGVGGGRSAAGAARPLSARSHSGVVLVGRGLRVGWGRGGRGERWGGVFCCQVPVALAETVMALCFLLQPRELQHQLPPSSRPLPLPPPRPSPTTPLQTGVRPSPSAARNAVPFLSFFFFPFFLHSNCGRVSQARANRAGSHRCDRLRGMRGMRRRWSGRVHPWPGAGGGRGGAGLARYRPTVQGPGLVG